MLLQFAVTNFRSFRETTVVSLVPAPGVEHRPGQTVRTGVPHVPEVLRAAIVYGANGAGKSNLIRAMTTLRRMVERGKVEPGIVPFRLAEHPEPTTFEIEAVVGGQHVSYGVSVRGPTVVWERMSVVETTGESVLFERGEENWWSHVGGSTDAEHAAAAALAQNIRSERLFLSAVGESAIQPYQVLFDWLTVEFWPAEELDLGAGGYLQFDEHRGHLRKLLETAGVGMADIEFLLDSPDPHVIRVLAEVGLQVGRPYPASALQPHLETVSLANPIPVLVRRTDRDAPAVFPLSDESDGTKRLVELGNWHYLLRHAGVVGIVDEVERSLHPLVVRGLIEPVFGEDTEGQLVCTTHDSWLLDLNLIPPDSVWFAEKDPSGATRLYSLAEFDRSQLAALAGDLERGYLHGRFGAIPFVGDARKLGWAR